MRPALSVILFTTLSGAGFGLLAWLGLSIALLDYLDGKRVGVFSFEGVFYEVSLKGGDMRRRVLLSSRRGSARLGRLAF